MPYQKWIVTIMSMTEMDDPKVMFFVLSFRNFEKTQTTVPDQADAH